MRGTKTTTTPTTSRSANRLRTIFYGPTQIRAGWRLAMFVLIVTGLWMAKAPLIRLLPHESSPATIYLLDKTLKFSIFLFASWIMARIESKTISDYGLPWRKMFGRQFWLGAGLAFLGLSAFLLMLRLTGIFRFGEVALRGGDIWKWGTLYALGFIVVGLEEEFHYRGYGLYTLAQGIGFWPAAMASSALFGYSHLGNAGENWLGLFNAGAGGLLFCLLLRRSGNLWMPIGFHACWDWAQSYFYGIPDSGRTLPGHLLDGSFYGPSWLTGGTVGPEGSLLLTLLLILFWLWISVGFSQSRLQRGGDG